MEYTAGLTFEEQRESEQRERMRRAAQAGPMEYLSADVALGYAVGAARRALSGWASGAADADDMASEAIARLTAKHRTVRLGILEPVCTGYTKRRIGATVRRLRMEYTAGRTRAERSAPLALSLDAANGDDADGNAARTGAPLLYTVADRMPNPEPTLSATGYGAVPTVLPDGSGTACIPDGYACRADGDRLTVLRRTGERLYGDDAWTVARSAVARTNAKSASGATRAVAAQEKWAEQDAAILRAVADSPSIAVAAERLGIGREAAKSRYRAARRRMAGLTTNRKRSAK